MELIERTFAYGSNLDLHQMTARCPSSGSRPPVVGKLPGHRLDFTRYSKGRHGGVADVVEDTNAEVWGVVYWLTRADLDALDKYEGYPTAYDRIQRLIQTPDGPIDNVWVYFVVNKQPFVPPTREYFDIIRCAASRLHFPEPYRIFLDTIQGRSAS